MRWGLTLVASLACAIGSVAACASILGLEEIPVASAEGGASDAIAAPEVEIDAGCDARGSSYCQRICPVPDFCDDFEQADPRQTWKAPPGLTQPITGKDGTLGVELDDAGSAEGRVLVGRATGTGTNSAVALFTHLLVNPKDDAPKVRGVQLLARIRVVDVSFLEHEAGVPDERYAGAFALSGVTAATSGVTVLLEEVPGKNELRVALTQRGIGDKGETTHLATLISVARDVIYDNPLELDLTVADQATFDRLGIPCRVFDPDASPTAPRVLIRFVNTGQCVALQGDFADPRWLEVPVLAAGIFVTEETHGEVRLDNVAVYLLR